MEKRKHAFNDFIISGNTVRWSILVLITVIFTIILYPNLATKRHSYQLGDVVERDIKAPKDFLVQDDIATEESRKRAVESVLTIYDHNTPLLSQLTKKVHSAFDIFKEIINAENQLPLENRPDHRAPDSAPVAEQPAPKTSVQDMIWQKKAEFEEKIGISVNKETYRVLEKNKFSTKIPTLITQILSAILDNGVVANKKILLTESDKGIALRDLFTKTETTVFNLKQFHSLDQSRTMVRIIGQPLLKELHYALVDVIVDFSQRLIQPNITLNQSATEERKNEVAEAVPPILYKIKAGEMLLREGERVTQIHLLKLENMQTQTSDDRAIASGMGVALLVVCLLLITYLAFLHNHPRIAVNYNKSALFLASVLIIFLAIIKVSAILSQPMAHSVSYAFSVASMTGSIPLAAGAMTICLFMGFQIAVPFAFILSALTAVLFQNQFDLFIYFFLSSLMGAFWIQNCRERKNLVKAGVKLGFLNLILTSVINLYMGEFAGIKLLWDWAFAMLGGISAGIVCLGITPLFEITFRYTTDITLLELANLDQPILKRLMLEAPGTYHHSILVGTMVEAAASEIGANPLLAKVCAYYHDIGKLKNPLYFIENQSSGKNRHDKLAPSMSSLILIAHIKSGVEIAKKNKLGEIILDTIKQHHGTSLISYFYEKAKQLKGEGNVNIENYRYPGPKPQTREAGLVMLADVVEAASRTLENPTPSRIQGLVQRMINKIFSDGQLDECELTLKDLHKIARSYYKMLSGIYHHRIEYVDSSARGNEKGKNGHSDQQQTKPAQNSNKKNEADDPGRLKRLGLS